MDQPETNGIWPPSEAFYLESMLFCTGSALDSLAELQASLERGATQSPDSVAWRESAEVILNSVQNIALQGAALSRYFWPARNREPHLSRAARLRSGLEVHDDSPLKDRSLRNQMEHFDERLDEFCHCGVVGHIFPQYVGPLPAEPEVPTYVFRAFYTDRGVFEILGRKYEMQPIVDEIAAIHERLHACCEAGGRIP